MSEDRPGTLEWYVVHTYSGYENKVKDNLEKAAENNGMQHLIQEITVPTEEVIEINKQGKRVPVQRKTYPGYVLVRMIITNESWYVVRNTRGVTGFVGPDSKPIPLSQAELDRMLAPTAQAACSINVGQEIRILSGPLENFTGIVEEVDTARQKLRAKVKMFLGREMPVELDLDQVEKIS